MAAPRATGLDLAGEVDRLLEDVGVDLEPERRLGPAAAEENPRDVQAVGRGVLEDVPGTAGRRLVEGAEDVAGSVRERQAGDRPACPGILVGERFPCQSSRTTRPSAPGGVAAAWASRTW